MRFLILHVNSFRCTITEKGRSKVYEPYDDPVTQVNEALIVLSSVERGDERDPECLSLPATLKKGSLSLKPQIQSDTLSVTGSFELADGETLGALDSPWEGLRVALLDPVLPNRLLACLFLPPGNNWRLQRNGFAYRDDRSSGKFSCNLKKKSCEVSVATKGLDLPAVTTGRLATQIRLLDTLLLNQQDWRSKAKGKKLVTP